MDGHRPGSWTEDPQTHRRVSRRGYLVGVEGLGCNMGCRSSLMGSGNPATSPVHTAHTAQGPSSCRTPQRDNST